MVIPTLLVKGSLVPTSDKVTKEVLDGYIAIHWILGLLEHKWKKPNPNIHDRIFILESLVGSGKTTVFIIEMFRKFFNTIPYNLEASKGFKDPVAFDYSIFDFPDDEYTIQNREKGFPMMVKKAHKMICAQPKVVLAINKAIEIASEDRNPDLELGVNVGYKTGIAKSDVKNSSQVLYSTMGSLTQMLKNKSNDSWLTEYEAIIIDEAHERSLELDEGLAYLRNLLRRNAGNPMFPMVVCMSATFDVGKYAEYLGTRRENSVSVVGGAISRDIFYLDHDPVDVYIEAAETTMKLHANQDPEDHCDILIFAPGEAEIKNIIKNIEKLDEKKELFITMLTAEINNKNGPEMDNILRKSLDNIRAEYKRPNIVRRVTVATPVVETGLTIVTLKYVIDTCLVKSTAYSPIHGLAQLVKQPCSLSSLEQRAGRAGRIKYGYIYRLMQQELMTKLQDYARPDIFTTDLSKVLLSMLYSNIDYDEINKPISNATFELFIKECGDYTHFNMSNKTENCKCMYETSMDGQSRVIKDKKFLGDTTIHTYPQPMLDRVTADVYITARNKLISLGFYGTYIGYLASKISRLSVESTRMVMAGYVHGVNIDDLITIGIFVDTGEMRYRYESSQMKKLKDKSIRQFSPFGLMRKVISNSTFKKHFGGDDSLLVNQMYDQFLEPLYLMRWYAATVRKVGPVVAIQKGKELGINLQTIYKFMDCRSDIQESFKKMGFIPTCSPIDFNSSSVFDDIVRIKKCIHSGYKNNVAYLMEDGIKYKTNTGLIISPKGIQYKFKPKKIVYGKLSLKLKAGSVFYESVPTYISAMDGII